jgi:outer membrane immunogenic protein
MTRAGGVVGAGFEYAIGGNLSAKVEGLYYNMGTLTSTGCNSPGVCTPGFTYLGFGTYALRGEIFRAGLNWHFGGSSVYTKD